MTDRPPMVCIYCSTTLEQYIQTIGGNRHNRHNVMRYILSGIPVRMGVRGFIPAAGYVPCDRFTIE